MKDLEDRAYGAMIGLCIGDAVGLPALFHRAARSGWRRRILWEFSAQLDEQNVNKFMLPFTLGPPDELMLCGTDDTEFAMVAAEMLLQAGPEMDPDTLFDQWHRLVVDVEDEVWGGIAERSSIINARKGLRPPITGNDNPHHYDDGAVARAVPVGVRFAGYPERAAQVAGALAAITNAEDGVFAAQAMAASISALVTGSSVRDALEVGSRNIPSDSWLGRQLDSTMHLLAEHGSLWAALPFFIDDVVNASYSFGNAAPETLPVAYAVMLGTDAQLVPALGCASLVAKQSDSMPAMVGALAGAASGAASIPPSWRNRLDRLRGVCVPSVAGASVQDITTRLVEAATAEASQQAQPGVADSPTQKGKP
jgi:ADP-ribosylglycohydrolase